MTLRFVGPTSAAVKLVRNATHHPILGLCDAFHVADEPQPRCLASAIDWDAPECIPALDRPGALPPGLGTAIMNHLATRAAAAGREVLRYRGPYPSAALFDTLLQSFRTVDAPADALTRFVADAEARLLAPRLETIPVDFVPAPHVWTHPTPRLCLQTRSGIERVYLDGRPFERERRSHRRVEPTPDGIALVVRVGGELWTLVAELDHDGTPRRLDDTAPAAPAKLERLAVVPELAQLLANAVAARAPHWLARLVTATPWTMRWADTGWDLARLHDGAVELHARLTEHLERDARATLPVLVEAIEPVLLRAAQRSLEVHTKAIVDPGSS